MNELEEATQQRAGTALGTDTLRRDVVAGLSQPKKTIPCKYLYDEQGARLFELICELDEYYPTRTELSILRANIGEIASLAGPHATLVDLGSGSGLKTRILLENLEQPAKYQPVDVARTQLLQCSARLAREFPELRIEPLCADYTRPFRLPRASTGGERTLIFFPGSTIGNFEPHEAVPFLRRMTNLFGPSVALLVGVDLKKSPQVLNPAYNDSKGVTARFNLNVLERLNRELQAGFELEQFQHRAFYNQVAGRIEMHLVSGRYQRVPVDGHEFVFAAGESIVTEHSYKYSVPEFRRLAARAGLEVVRVWTDERHWFSVQYLEPRHEQRRHAGGNSR